MTSKMTVKIKTNTFFLYFQLFFHIFTIHEGCEYLLSESHPGHFFATGKQARIGLIWKVRFLNVYDFDIRFSII